MNNGVVIPVKMRRCNECENQKLCVTCKNQVIENEEFEAKLNGLRGQAPKDFGLMFH